VTLVAVSKTVPADRLVAAVEAGLTTLGENRVQEAEPKVAAVAGATWHLIGPLQSNKARRALEAFDVIESVDSVDLASRLDRLAGELDRPAPVPILLQVNVDADPAKAGFAPADLERASDSLDGLGRLDVRGLMTVGRLVERAEDARPTFAALAALATRLRDRWPRLGPELSMGMSDDYPVAIEEGATLVRVGRALFGERPHA
jgi:pyridoxal phosphate enzyme (YggS family)